MAVSMSIDFKCSLHVGSGLPLVAMGVPNQPDLQVEKGLEGVVVVVITVVVVEFKEILKQEGKWFHHAYK